MRALNAVLFVFLLSVFGLTARAQSVSVSILPTTARLLVTGPQEFTATVTNDASNSGVTWTVAGANGTACSGAACGTVSPTSTSSGEPTAYEAPSSVPSGGTIVVIATSVTDPTKSASATITILPAVNDARLSGDYAFKCDGMRGGGPFVLACVGRFTADAAGNVTNGEVDVNSNQSNGPVVIQETFTGTYVIGADNRGVMTWYIPSGNSSGNQLFAQLTFAMKADGSAVFAVFDPNLSAQEFGSGTMEPADSSSYSTTQIRGDYAFGFAGFDLSNNRTAFAGRLSADGLGTFTNFDAIFNTSGGANETTVTLATYRVSDTSSGRGTISLAGLVGLVPRSFNFVFYVVNAGKLFVMETDPALLQNGVFLRQNMPAGGFTLASLNTSAVIYLTGHSACGEGSSPATEALVGLLIPNGGGALTLSHDQNCGGTDSSSSGEVGTYTVETNGHACIFVGTTSGVAFLVNSNRFFFVGTDNSVLFGLGEPQSIGSLTNSSVMGTYAGFTSTVAPFDGTSFSGEFIADGASPNGNLTGTEDTSGTRGPDSGVAVSATYSVSALPTNGRGTISIASGSGVSAIMYVVSPSKFVAVSLSDPNPAVQIFEQ